MVGAITDALYTLDTTTGAATQVGSADQFGTGVEDRFFASSGLTAIGDTLYMAASRSGGFGIASVHALYTVDTTSGEATEVALASSFGIADPGRPGGLAAIGDTLYMVWTTLNNDVLYTVDTTSFTATRVDSTEGLVNFGLAVEENPRDLAAIGSGSSAVLYMLGNTPNGSLYRVDPTSSVATRVGSAINFGEGVENAPAGIAAIGSGSGATLYMVGDLTDTLYTLNTTTAVTTRVGNAPTGFGVDEIRPTGLVAITASDGTTTLYMVGATNNALYRVDTTSGIATRVGNAPAGFGVDETSPGALAATSDGTLYMVGPIGDVLYRVDTTSGIATRVGNAPAGFGVGEDIPQGMAATSDGALYMVGATNSVLYRVDRTTGIATRVGNVSAGFGVGEDAPQGMAVIDDVLYMVGVVTGAALLYRAVLR